MVPPASLTKSHGVGTVGLALPPRIQLPGGQIRPMRSGYRRAGFARTRLAAWRLASALTPAQHSLRILLNALRQGGGYGKQSRARPKCAPLPFFSTLGIVIGGTPNNTCYCKIHAVEVLALRERSRILRPRDLGGCRSNPIATAAKACWWPPAAEASMYLVQ